MQEQQDIKHRISTKCPPTLSLKIKKSQLRIIKGIKNPSVYVNK